MLQRKAVAAGIAGAGRAAGGIEEFWLLHIKRASVTASAGAASLQPRTHQGSLKNGQTNLPRIGGLRTSSPVPHKESVGKCPNARAHSGEKEKLCAARPRRNAGLLPEHSMQLAFIMLSASAQAEQPPRRAAGAGLVVFLARAV